MSNSVNTPTEKKALLVISLLALIWGGAMAVLLAIVLPGTDAYVLGLFSAAPFWFLTIMWWAERQQKREGKR